MSVENSSPTTATIFNTTLFGNFKATPIEEYFHNSSKLGSYSVIEVYVSPTQKAQVVVDQHMPWLQKSLEQFFNEPQITKLSVKQILDYLTYLRDQGRKLNFSLATFLGLAPHKNVDNAKSLKVFYLDDIREDDSQKSLIMALVTQILFEKYTTRDSRIAVIEQTYQNATERSYVVLVKSLVNGYQIIDGNKELFNSDNMTLKFVSEISFDENDNPIYWDIKTAYFKVVKPAISYSERSKVFSIINGNGEELSFAVLGRTPAEKRFKKEQEQIQTALDQDLVPIEISFHPFWRRLGHTTLRIGDALYELSSKGWKSHNQGQDTARAYLFNNPFFKAQYAIYAPSGMPPVSIAVTMMIRKEQAIKLQITAENLAAASGRQREKFNLYLNNCNQGIMRILLEAGLSGFTDRGYKGFSSVLSFRQLLVNPPLERVGLYIYPLPGAEINEATLRQWIPRLLYRYNNTYMEIFRAIPSLAWDSIVFGARRLSDLIYKVFKIRLWKGLDAYQYLNT